MSLIAGSRSSGSSGPRPNTSSSTSAKSVSRSPRLSGVASSASSCAEQRADLALGARPIGLRQRLEVQPVEQLAVHVRAQLEVLLPRRRLERRAGRGAARVGAAVRIEGAAVAHVGYQMDASRSRPSSGRAWRRLAGGLGRVGR